MASIEWVIDTSGLQKRINDYISALKERLTYVLEEAATECVEDCLSRAPSHEEEYDKIMRGSNDEINLIPLGTDQSSDSSPFGRIRFIRSPGKWLRDLVTDTNNISIDTSTFSINLGRLSYMEEMTRFSWVAARRGDPRRGTGPETFPKTSSYGLFRALEYGGAYMVRPQGQWPLTPDDLVKWPYVPKNYGAGYKIYTGFHKSTFSKAIRTRLEDIRF